ncbi:5'-methylthioadenosine/S-adenosylhomocysteine nucleosidase family protein [Aspergillus vadensis CBS 113365]|uniref:Purine and uridine phosphorylase n=1 Tax=Aspergillus vadensis (strain CBS 113365 / IMI 142717 / IBT 24658) TaxID=1448311 RepID=A0A319B6L6_ASPVC|nr:purine and uridine phosphorylase [Aspergillus vadensis CBS 113365]PYH67979.1 purine and uridine phosphorylase [Aspergillus vadensis CBS 113365]
MSSRNPTFATDSVSSLRKPPPSCDFTVGWICAIFIEYLAALEVLDEKFEAHPGDVQAGGDYNEYTRGRIGNHYVVVVCLPAESYGLASAATVVTNMRSTFPTLRFAVMVGIAGGSPRAGNDVRLGDVVVGTMVKPARFGKDTTEGFEHTGHVPRPPEILLCRVNHLKRRTLMDIDMGRIVDDKIRALGIALRNRFQPRSKMVDRLYASDYIHSDDCDCIRDKSGLPDRIVAREERLPRNRLMVHSGPIASGDQVIKNAKIRDRDASKLGTICFDMESAALTSINAIVIRGICDYADSHKNDEWHGYAAMAAALTAVEFLKLVPVADVQKTQIGTTEEEVRRFVEASIDELKVVVDGSLSNHQEAILRVQASLEGVDQRFLLLDRLKESVTRNEDELSRTAVQLHNLEESHNKLATALQELAETILQQENRSSSVESKREWATLRATVTSKSAECRKAAAFIGETLDVAGDVLESVGDYTNKDKLRLASHMTHLGGRFISKRGDKQADSPVNETAAIEDTKEANDSFWQRSKFEKPNFISQTQDKFSGLVGKMSLRKGTKVEPEQSSGIGRDSNFETAAPNGTNDHHTSTPMLDDRRAEPVVESPRSSTTFSSNTGSAPSERSKNISGGPHKSIPPGPLRPKPDRLRSRGSDGSGGSVQSFHGQVSHEQVFRSVQEPAPKISRMSASSQNTHVLNLAKNFEKNGSANCIIRPIQQR